MSLQKQIYCLKERTYTDNVNPQYVTTKNGRLMIKAACASCGKLKSKFVKQGGSIDIHKAMLPLLPKKGLTLPGYNYCGPGNPLVNGSPVNQLDEVCMNHDYCYDSGLSKSECDKKMLSDLKTTKSKTIGEKLAKNLVVKPVINMKYKLGLGQTRNSKNGRRGQSMISATCDLPPK